MSRELTSPNFAAPSDDDDDLLPIHSFNPTNIRSSPPRTPPMRTRSVSKRNKGENGAGTNGKTGEEGADLLLYLAASPSPAVRTSTRTRMEPPSTPPQKNKQMDLPSSMMMTPGGGNLFPTTPSQAFDFAEFVNITPSPAQKPFKTPISITTTRTPVSGTQRRLTFD
jgi:hypothetical protein